MPGDLVEIESPALGLSASLWATPDSEIINDAVGYFTFGIVLGTYDEFTINPATDEPREQPDAWLLVVDSSTARIGWLTRHQVRAS